MKKVTKKKEKAKKGRQVCSGDTIHLSFIGRGPPLRSIFFRNKCNDSNVQRHLLWVFYDAECSSRSFRLRQKNRKREKAAKMHLFALANKLLSMYLICQLLSPLARVIKFSDTQPWAYYCIRRKKVSSGWELQLYFWGLESKTPSLGKSERSDIIEKLWDCVVVVATVATSRGRRSVERESQVLE